MPLPCARERERSAEEEPTHGGRVLHLSRPPLRALAEPKTLSLRQPPLPDGSSSAVRVVFGGSGTQVYCTHTSPSVRSVRATHMLRSVHPIPAHAPLRILTYALVLHDPPEKVKNLHWRRSPPSLTPRMKLVVCAIGTAAALQVGVPCGHQPRAALTMSAATAFDLAKYMEEKRVYTESILDASLTSTTPETDIIVESMRYSLMAGGKRVRPMLCFAATEMFGGSAETAAPAAVGLEMIHTMSLIHDDLPSMDNDDFRRGKPTNHKLYGEDIAILAGDAMLSTAFEYVAKNTKGVPAERVLKVLQIMTECVGPLGLAGGQVMDLKSEGAGVEVGLETLEWIHTYKTAALLKAAVASGAVLAGASDEEVEKCNIYAQKIGLAFQVADDILDVTASTEDLGKTAGKDLDADKTTYPKLLGLDRSREVAQELVDDAKAALADFGDRAAPVRALPCHSQPSTHSCQPTRSRTPASRFANAAQRSRRLHHRAQELSCHKRGCGGASRRRRDVQSVGLSLGRYREFQDLMFAPLA